MHSRIIGLTGPTGAGKSTWSAAFRTLGCAVIDCDKLARKVVENPAVQTALQVAFGGESLKSGVLDRRLLASRAFADKQSVQRLNVVTHPAILEQITHEITEYEQRGIGVIIIDAPQLFEGGLEKMCTLVAAVLAPQQIRLKRIMQRDKISEEEAWLRMASQYGDDYFKEHADCILDGSLLPQEVPRHAQKRLRAWLGESI